MDGNFRRRSNAIQPRAPDACQPGIVEVERGNDCFQPGGIELEHGGAGEVPGSGWEREIDPAGGQSFSGAGRDESQDCAGREFAELESFGQAHLLNPVRAGPSGARRIRLGRPGGSDVHGEFGEGVLGNGR